MEALWTALVVFTPMFLTGFTTGHSTIVTIRGVIGFAAVVARTRPIRVAVITTVIIERVIGTTVVVAAIIRFIITRVTSITGGA